MSREDTSKLYVTHQNMGLPLGPEGFKLKQGGVLERVDIAYETYGSLNAAGDNAVLVCTPLTMDAHAAGWYTDEDTAPGWWDEMIGPGKALDTTRYYVVCSNILGGCMGTTGPSSLNPKTSKPYGSEFPLITIEDMVEAQYALIGQLGIKRLAAVVGGSMGGMQAIQWAVAHSDKVDKCICIAAAAHLSPQALGFEIAGRKVLASDSNFANGDYYDKDQSPDKGLAFARMIGLLTYISADSMGSKFGRQRHGGFDPLRFETGYEVENYLNYNSNKFIDRFDANAYLHITYAMDTYDLVREFGSLEDAFKESKCEFLLLSLSSDWLFPPEQSRQLARVLLKLGKIVSLIELDSPHGHDAFLLEVGHLSKVLYSFLKKYGSLETPGGRIPAGEHSAAGDMKNIFGFSGNYRHIESLIEPESHILDVGCGNGDLIDHLYLTHGITGFGIDIEMENILQCLINNVPVINGDVDKGLDLFDNDTFDYAVMSQTLQMLKKPRFVLGEMLRVARKGILVFPNFGNLHNRFILAVRGVMPVTEGLPYRWWETPNIHFFTFKDFLTLCGDMNIEIETLIPLGKSFCSRVCLKLGKVNFGADLIVAKISRGSGYQNGV